MQLPIEIVLDEHPRREERKRLEREIDLFNARTVPGEDERFALFLRDSAGTLAGGLDGVIGWAWLFVDNLWVHEELRGRGFGRELLARAERFAAARGCHSVWLDTFQARGFYEHLGYAVFASLEDYPPGQTKYFLRKRLIRTPG
ncbi:MAG TPA: GNAT family N-acetyltransferase [Stellaceae bacterium]|nr:GNAT family N-acetyltransferase [Stellaceae bacterium]HYC14233.1 GNAT family N-acetyltransferase [Stellaceae bacterium]